jgi:hypothetical protein
LGIIKERKTKKFKFIGSVVSGVYKKRGGENGGKNKQ